MVCVCVCGRGREGGNQIGTESLLPLSQFCFCAPYMYGHMYTCTDTCIPVQTHIYLSMAGRHSSIYNHISTLARTLPPSLSKFCPPHDVDFFFVAPVDKSLLSTHTYQVVKKLHCRQTNYINRNFVYKAINSPSLKNHLQIYSKKEQHYY